MRYLPLGIILVVYFIIGSLFAINVPDWQAPDEPAHYNYIAQLANGRFPEIEPGDYDQAYLDEIRGAQFAAEYSIESIEYEDWQPPLYYILLTPIFMLTNGSLIALRLTSLLIGAGVITLAYFIALELFPKNPWAPMTTAVFIAFLPQHVSILASINNDSLAELIIAAILLMIFIWMREDTDDRMRNRFYLINSGMLLGFGFLTKLTVYLMVPVLFFVLLWRYWGKWDRLIRAYILLYAPAFLWGSLWWARNLFVYDGIDPLAMGAHNAVVVGQPRTIEWVNTYGLGGTIQRFFQTTFNSFWGQFGWMAVPMKPWVYLPLLIFSILVIVGLLFKLVQMVRARGNETVWSTLVSLPLLTLLLVSLFTAATHVYYNLTFVQHQGRYLFPALVPISIGVALSLDVWVLAFSSRTRSEWATFFKPMIPLGLGLLLAALDLVALYKFILPSLT